MQRRVCPTLPNPEHRVVDPACSAAGPRSASRQDRTRPRLFRARRRCLLPLECRMNVAQLFVACSLFPLVQMFRPVAQILLLQS